MNIEELNKYYEVIDLFNKKLYTTSISKIEDLLSRDRNSSFLYTLLGINNIFLQNYNEAKIYLNKAIELNKINIEAINALAFICLKEHNVELAIEYYLKILEISPKDKIATRTLKKFKKSEDIEKILRHLHPADFIFIKIPFIRKNITYIFIIILIIIVLTGLYFIYIIASMDNNSSSSLNSKPTIKYYDSSNLDNKNSDFESGKVENHEKRK